MVAVVQKTPPVLTFGATQSWPGWQGPACTAASGTSTPANEQMGRIFQDLNHRVKSCGAAVCISLNSGAWWEGLQGCFFVIPHACKESSNPLLPLSHACVKARSPCLFSSGTLAGMILSSFFFPSLMGLTGASGADVQLYYPAAFLFLSYQEELFLKSLNFFFSPAPTCSLLVPRLLFPSPWYGAAGP